MNKNNTINDNRSLVPNAAPVPSGSLVPNTERRTINWKRKLTSRKFWLSVASFTAMLLAALGKSQETATQVTSIIMAGATVIGYAIGEGLADGEQAGHSDETRVGEGTHFLPPPTMRGVTHDFGRKANHTGASRKRDGVQENRGCSWYSGEHGEVILETKL